MFPAKSKTEQRCIDGAFDQAGDMLNAARRSKTDMIFIPPAQLAGRRQKAVQAKPFKINPGTHGNSRGIKMQHTAF